jgi:hypothetical protein
LDQNPLKTVPPAVLALQLSSLFIEGTPAASSIPAGEKTAAVQRGLAYK